MAEEQVRLELLKHLAKVEREYSLQEFSPFRSGGVADYFTTASDAVELAAAVKVAIDLNLPYCVVGQASRLLFSDGGFPGLVIHNKTSAINVAKEKSQIVADSGLLVSQCITRAASQGLGGLTAFYGQKGSIGGAVYHNLQVNGQSFLSSVRFITMIMPPARLDKEATIVRYKTEWLEKDEALTKLEHWKATRPLELPQPVILTVLLQLTSVRVDELLLRLQQQMQQVEQQQPPGPFLGPLFFSDGQIPLEELLLSLELHRVKIGTLTPLRRFPNYLTARPGQVRSQEVRQLIEEIQARVRVRYGIDLVCRYEFVGVW